MTCKIFYFLCCLKVSEDLKLLQHVKASLLDFAKPNCSEKSSDLPHRTNDDDDQDQLCANADHQMVDSLDLENQFSPLGDNIRSDQRGTDEDFNMDFPDECSNACEHDHQTEDSIMPASLNCGTSQVQSWHLVDDDFSNGVQDSMNSSKSISDALINQEKTLPSSRHENRNKVHLKELQKFNDTKLNSLDDLGADEDLHYKRTLFAILLLGGSSQLIENHCFCDYDHQSSFAAWRKGHDNNYRPWLQQKMLKKILFTVPFMYNGSSLEFPNEDLGKNWLENSKKVYIRHVKYEKSRENDSFLVLKSMVPSVTKVIFSHS